MLNLNRYRWCSIWFNYRFVWSDFVVLLNVRSCLSDFLFSLFTLKRWFCNLVLLTLVWQRFHLTVTLQLFYRTLLGLGSQFTLIIYRLAFRVYQALIFSLWGIFSCECCLAWVHWVDFHLIWLFVFDEFRIVFLEEVFVIWFEITWDLFKNVGYLFCGWLFF